MLRQFSDRLLGLRLKKDEKEIRFGFFIIGIVVVFLLGNIAYLNWTVFNNEELKSETSTSSRHESETSVGTDQNVVQSQKVEESNNEMVVKSKNAVFKDYYINIGSGSNKSTDWTDVGGALSTFDMASYNNIQEIRLESNTNVPTSNGTVSIRLFNKTDNHPVWNSERTVQSEKQGGLLISEKIVYDAGPKLYQVQMKTQLGVEANLIQSRIHIVAE